MEKIPTTLEELEEFEKKYGLDKLRGIPTFDKPKELMSIEELQEYIDERKKYAIESIAGQEALGMKFVSRPDNRYAKKTVRLSAYISNKGKPTYIRLDGCYTFDQATELLRTKIDENEKHRWILDKFYEGVSEMELKHYGAVTRNSGAIRLKAYSKQEALVKFREKDKSIQADDIYQKIGETWDETTFDCE